MPGKERPQKGNDTYCGMCRERIAPSRGSGSRVRSYAVDARMYGWRGSSTWKT